MVQVVFVAVLEKGIGEKELVVDQGTTLMTDQKHEEVKQIVLDGEDCLVEQNEGLLQGYAGVWVEVQHQLQNQSLFLGKFREFLRHVVAGLLFLQIHEGLVVEEYLSVREH